MAVLHPDVKEVAARKNAVAQARASVQNGTAATNTTIPRQTSNGTKIKVDLTPKKSAVSAASLIDTARENVQKSTDTINSQQTRRNMLRKISERQAQESKPEKWYSGDTPTSSEIQARIYNISKTDSARAEQLYSDFERYQADPSSPIYNPYTTATSKAVSELGALGYDVSNFDSSWLESNASLMNSYRTSTGTTPLAPSSSSTAEQDAAYWYYKAYSDEQTTQKAEQEWQALQDEITYWTNRTDRNYSDDEILAKIDWSNYKTLTGMDESAAKGTPTQLTRSIGYSQDALKGVIWAARNNGGTNDGLNSVRAALGQGNQWTENMETAAKLDPTSDSYSPYSVSSTMDDAALYFGVSEFSSDWCAENRDILAGDDETAKKYYTQIYNAEQTTEKAESELEQLNARIDRYVDAYDDPEKILTYLSNSLEDDFPTLAKMDKGMASGDLVSTTRAVGYSWNDIKQQVEQKCAEKSNAPTASSVIENTMGVTVNADQTMDAISGAAKTNIQEATDLIDASGTEAEKHAAANPTMSTATANASVIRKSFAANALKQVESTISPTVPATANAKPPLPAKAEETAEEKSTPETTPAPTNATAAATATATDVPVGTQTEAQEKKTYSSFEDIIAPLREHTQQRDSMNLAMMNVAYQQAENYAAKNYQSAMRTTKEYEAAQAKAASAQAELDKMLSQDSWVRENLNIDVEQAEASYAGNETALEMLEVVKEAQALQAQVQTAQEEMSALSGDYEQAQDVLDNIARTYTNFHNFNNYITEGQAGLSMLDVLDVVSDFSGNYQTNYYTTTPVEQMVENGESGTAAVQHVTESAQNNIDAIDAVLAYIDEKGIQADDQCINNLKKAREENEQYLTEAEYYQLRNKEDFASTVAETKTALYDQAHSTDAWMPTSQTAMDADWTDPKYGTTRLTYVITGDNEITPYYGIAQYMTQGERDTYTYLYATQGQNAAKEYYNDLASTVLTVRQATEEQEGWEQAAEEHPILSSAISILASPLQSFGTLYSVAAAIRGEEINPYDSSFAPSSLITTVRSTVKGNIDKGLADNQFIKTGANMLYDAAVSAGESALNTVLGGGALSAGVTSALAKDGMGKLATFGVKALSSLAGAAPMGVQAAGTAMRDVKLRGGTNNQALAIGAVTFVAETGTEAITFDNIQEAFNAASAGQAKSFLKTLVGSALEEAPGEMVNELVEGVADEQIMGDLSSRKQTIDEYRAKGYTKEEATKKAYVDFAKDILYAGVVGAISGGMSSGASYVAGKVSSARTLSTENAQTDVNNALDELTNGMLNTNEQTIRQTQQESPAEAPAENATEMTAESPAETVEESTAETAGTAQEAPASAENGTQEEQQQQTKVDEANRAIEEAQKPTETTEIPTETAETPAETAEPTAQEQEENDWAAITARLRVTNLSNALLITDQTYQTALIADALNNDNGNESTATLAAEELTSALGVNKAVGFISDALNTWANNPMGTFEQLQQGIINTIMAGGEKISAIQSIAEAGNGITFEQLDELLTLTAEEQAAAQVNTEQKAHESRTANRVIELIGDGALTGLRTYQSAVVKAQQNLVKARSQAERTDARVKACGENLQTLTAQFNENPTDASLSGFVQQAIKDLEGAVNENTQAKETLETRQRELTEAKDTLKSMQEQALAKIRQQAVQEVGQQEEQERAERETQEQQRQAEEQKRQAEQQKARTPKPQADAIAADASGTSSAPATTTNSDNVLSGDEITRNMEAVTNIPIDKRIKKYERNLRKITRGYAYPIQGTTHLKDASNVGTACHEYGHVFDERYGLQAHAGDALIDQMVNNITSGNNYDGRLAYMAYTPEQLRGESIAEFTRLWMQDRDSAIRFASQDLVDYLESSLKHDGWLKGMQQARVDWQLLRNAQAGEVAKAQVALTPTKKARSKYQKGILGLWTKLMDRTTPLASITDTYTESKNNVQSDIDYSRDPRTIALAMSNHVRTFTESCLVDNMVDAEGNIVTNESGEAYGSLSGIMERNNITEDLEQDFNAYLLLRHAQYRQDAVYMQSNGMDVKAIFGADVNVDEALRQLEAAHPEFRKASDDLYAWYEKFVQTWVIDTHASDMTQEDFDALRSLYPCYVPTYRANMSEGSGNGSNINSDPGNSIFRRATGGTTQVYNPVMGLVENIQNYIAIEKQLESYRAFAQQLKDGNVDIGIAEFAQPDMEVVDNRKQNQTAQETLAQTISEILKDNPDAISSEAVQQLTTAMDALPERSYYFEETASGNDVLNFRDANGKMVRLTVYDKPTAQALTMVKAKDVPKAVQAVGAWTRFLCAMSTSLNVGFAGQNILSDSETAMSTMKAPFWKKLAPTFIGQQLNSARMVIQNEIAARTGHEVSEDYRNFKLFGEMDSRYALRENKTQREVRQSLYANRKGINLTNVSNVAKAIITSPVTTVEALTDLLENTTRYTAWRADNERSGTDYSTKLRKGQNAREATVDFSKSGSAEGTLRVAKMVIPFLGASMQGINKTATMFTNQNKGNRASTAAAIVCNSLLTNLVMAAVRSLTWDDDEQEAYDTLSDYEKNKYWHIKVGEGDNTTFVRLKRSQDAIIQAVDAVGTYLGETLTGYEGDSLGDLMGCAQQIASNLIPSTSFVWNGVTDALNNQTWYGSDIEGYTDQQKPVTQRYDEDTTEFSKGLSVLLNGVGVQLSPLQLDYILQQYTGSLGQIGMDLMSNATNGTLNAESFVDTLADRIGAKFVIDPASSNGLTSNFYDGYEQFTQLTTEAKQDGTMSLLRASLTQEEANAAVEEAVSLTSKGGALYEAKQTMNDLWKEYNSVLENENITKEERNAKAREIRQEINKQCVAANLTMGDYWNKYGYNNNAVRAYDNFMQFISGEDGNTYTPKTSYEQLPQIFLDDADTEYMQAAKETWEATGSDVCLPHPPTSYTQDKVKVELTGEDQTVFNETYRDAYENEFINRQGDYETAETDEEKKKILQSCHTKALNAAKKEYKNNHPDAFKQ